MISWREHIPNRNQYTDNRAAQALLADRLETQGW